MSFFPNYCQVFNFVPVFDQKKFKIFGFKCIKHPPMISSSRSTACIFRKKYSHQCYFLCGLFLTFYVNPYTGLNSVASPPPNPCPPTTSETDLIWK